MKRLLTILCLLSSQSWGQEGCIGNCVNGYGTYTYADGDQYVGEWKDDKIHGQGTYTFASGAQYVGEYKDGRRHGQGTNTYADGDQYVGEWKDDKLHGQGTFTFADGEQYVGELKDDKRHGQGTYTYADGDQYVGESKDGKRHGQGTYTDANGAQYVGEYKDGKRHGQGTFTFADGRKQAGIWENSEYLGTIEEAKRKKQAEAKAKRVESYEKGKAQYKNEESFALRCFEIDLDSSKYYRKWYFRGYLDLFRENAYWLLNKNGYIGWSESISDDRASFEDDARVDFKRNEINLSSDSEDFLLIINTNTWIGNVYPPQPENENKALKCFHIDLHTIESSKDFLKKIEQKKYDKFYNACLLDKGKGMSMEVDSIRNAVEDTCKSIAKDPSWFQKLKYE